MLKQWKQRIFRPPDRRYPLRGLFLISGLVFYAFSLVSFDPVLYFGRFLVGTMCFSLFVADT